MRYALSNLNGERGTFRGTFVRTGSKAGFRGGSLVTVLLSKITDSSGKVLTDHLWFNYTNEFQRHSPLVEGDVFEFDASVTEYVKGFGWNQELDFKLSRPTRIRKFGRSVPCEGGAS